MTTWITVCETCKRDGWQPGGSGATDGETLLALIRAATEGRDNLRLRAHPCLMGCQNGCNVAIQADGKMSYTLGGLGPTAAEAEAVVAYAAHHAQSDAGIVAWANWPEPLKGHFVTRHPPLSGLSES